MKRRRMLQSLAVAPAAGLLPSITLAQTPGAGAAAVEGLPVLPVVAADTVGTSGARFFSSVQYATLDTLAGLLIPAMAPNPGAREAKAVPFLDFLMGRSPADRQQLYRSGLDRLEQGAQARYQRGFAKLAPAEADVLLAPLRTQRSYLPSDDPFTQFLHEVKADLLQATVSSREWAMALPERRNRRVQYWHPLGHA